MIAYYWAYAFINVIFLHEDPLKHCLIISVMTLALGVLVACGGGGGSSSTASATPASTAAGQSLSSSGAITAFGSVFINGHEFNTGSTSFVDDDTGMTATNAAGLGFRCYRQGPGTGPGL